MAKTLTADTATYSVRFRVLNRKPLRRNIVIPAASDNDKSRDEAIKKVIAGEYKNIPISAVTLLKDAPAAEVIPFKGGEPEAPEAPKGPMTVDKVRAMKKPELLKYAEVNEFELENPESHSEDELRELVAMLFEDRQKGLEAKK